MGKNAASINALISAIQGGLSTGQSYDLMRQIADDLKDTSDKVEKLIAQDFIDPALIASPGDIPAKVTSPGNVAFTNWPNVFTRTPQSITIDLAALELRTTIGTKAGRMKMIADDDLMLSENIDWSGTVYSSDAAAVGMMLELKAGEAIFNHWTGAAIVERLKIDAAGVVSIGNPFKTGVGQDELIFKNNKSIWSANAAGNAIIQIVKLDANDVIRVATSNAATGVGHFAIPDRATANLPAAAANQDGTIVIEKGAPPNLIIYTGGLRYRVAPGAAVGF